MLVTETREEADGNARMGTEHGWVSRRSANRKTLFRKVQDGGGTSMWQNTSTPPPEDRIFHCVSQCMVRSGFAMDSEANGMLEPGTRITALQSRTTEGGAERLRFDKGWVSVVSKSGAKTFLVEVISTHGHHTKSFADDGIRDKFTKSNQEQFFFKFLFIKSRAVFRKFLFIKS